MDIITLTKCPDVRCFHKNHIYCSSCYNVLHANCNVFIQECKDITCVRSDHFLCPHCFIILHVHL